MQTRTVIAYVPGKGSKVHKKSLGIMDRFRRTWKLMLLAILILIYLIYTNQSSTLGYSLRRSLKEVERAQDTLDDLELDVGQTEQRLWSSVEWVSNKNKVKKIVIN